MDDTTFLFARPRLWCRIFGHNFRHNHTERLYRSPFSHFPVTIVKYKECRCCPTRMAEMSGVVRPDILNFNWLREKFDDNPAH